VAEMSSGRAVIELLKAERVRHIFGIVGSTFLEVLDALYDDPSVEYINVRHEQGGAFMADGLARITGLPAQEQQTSSPVLPQLMWHTHQLWRSLVVRCSGTIPRMPSRSSTWSVSSNQ
jgi:glyoxylate carboligase